MDCNCTAWRLAAISVGSASTDTPNNIAKVGLGSAPISNTLEPWLANCFAAAIAMVVRPTPPLPKKVRINDILISNKYKNHNNDRHDACPSLPHL